MRSPSPSDEKPYHARTTPSDVKRIDARTRSLSPIKERPVLPRTRSPSPANEKQYHLQTRSPSPVYEKQYYDPRRPPSPSDVKPYHARTKPPSLLDMPPVDLPVGFAHIIKDDDDFDRFSRSSPARSSSFASNVQPRKKSLLGDGEAYYKQQQISLFENLEVQRQNDMSNQLSFGQQQQGNEDNGRAYDDAQPWNGRHHRRNSRSYDDAGRYGSFGLYANFRGSSRSRKRRHNNYGSRGSMKNSYGRSDGPRKDVYGSKRQNDMSNQLSFGQQQQGNEDNGRAYDDAQPWNGRHHDAGHYGGNNYYYGNFF